MDALWFKIFYLDFVFFVSMGILDEFTDCDPHHAPWSPIKANIKGEPIHLGKSVQHIQHTQTKERDQHFEIFRFSFPR